MPNAHTGPLPTREQLFDQQKFEDGPRAVPPLTPVGPTAPPTQPGVPEDSQPAAASAPPEPSAAPAPERLPFDAPPLPLGLIEADTELVEEDLERALEEEPAREDEPQAYQPPYLTPPPQGTPQRTPQRPAQRTNLGIAHRDGPRHAETEDEKAARAHIPSWDDILLGVRRKND